MEKRNRLKGRGQSPPPKGSKGKAARIAAAAALVGALVAVVWVVAGADTGGALLVAGSLLVGVPATLTAWIKHGTAWVDHGTARVNRETAEINRELAEHELRVRHEGDSGGD